MNLSKFALVASAMAMCMAGCQRAPEIEGPGRFLQISIWQNWTPHPAEAPPSEMTFQGVAEATHGADWLPHREMECDFPDGITLRSPCIFEEISMDVSIEPIAAVPVPRDLSHLLFDPSKPKPNPPKDYRRFGVSGGLDLKGHLPPSGTSLSYIAYFPIRRLPLRYRIYDGSRLVCRGEIQLVPPTGAEAGK